MTLNCTLKWVNSKVYGVYFNKAVTKKKKKNLQNPSICQRLINGQPPQFPPFPLRIALQSLAVYVVAKLKDYIF